MNHNRLFILILVVSLFALTGCRVLRSIIGGNNNLPTAVPTLNTPATATATTTVAPTAIATTAVATTAVATTASPTTPPTQPPVTTAAPSSTSTTVPPTAVPPTATIPAPTATQAPTPCTDAATFINDVTIPDGSQFPPNTGFVKTWRIQNSGTCTWDGRYRLVHVGGPRLGAISDSIAIPATVAPGQTIDLSLNLVSPADPGNYQSDWLFSNPQDVRFGVGRSNSPLWIRIAVSPAATASISGYAWQDRNQNNQPDPNEYLPGVTIILASGTECQTTINSTGTDVNGRFRFTNLPAATYCLTGTDGSVTVGQAAIPLAANQQLTDVAVTWPPIRSNPTIISGRVYQDTNNNGVFDSGEPTAANREVLLIPAACRVAATPQATTFSAPDGTYTFSGDFGGDYCVALRGTATPADATDITVTAGQTLNNINLRLIAENASISGFLWNDYCSAASGTGNCVPDGFGSLRADGMIQPSETYIAGATIKLQSGQCSNDITTALTITVTDSSGRYTFDSLPTGTYCVYMNAGEGTNISLLLPGDWTFPAPGLWYHQLTLNTNDLAFPVNFGWDYQLD